MIIYNIGGGRRERDFPKIKDIDMIYIRKYKGRGNFENEFSNRCKKGSLEWDGVESCKHITYVTSYKYAMNL